MFLRLLPLFLCAFIMLTPLSPAKSQGLLPTTDESAAQDESVTVDKESLSELIETLESETSRQEFIENLKTIQETTTTQGEPPKPQNVKISSVFDIKGHLTNFSQNYRAFLERHNLNTTAVGQAALSIGTVFAYIITLLLIRKLCFGMRDKLGNLRDHFSLQHDRFRLYARAIRYAGYTTATGFLMIVMGSIWDVSDFAFLQSGYSAAFFGNLISIVLVIFIGIIIWESISGFIEYGMRRADRASKTRMKTLLPIVRNVSFVTFALLFALVLLSELGINIMPLLAGAGIFGIAVGFGAQTMVKDFLTGFTIILEDLIQVGDVATVGGKTGLIEKITIRKVQLRDLNGTVYTVPFSNIDVVENLTKDFSFYLMDIGVAYRENTDEVIKYLEEVDEELRNDETFGPLILEPLHILGVDQFADSAVIIKARIKTLPIKQWDVGREFNRRMKIKFDEMGVEIPFPHQTIYFGEDKSGNAPAAHIRLRDMRDDAAANDDDAAPTAEQESAKKKNSKDSKDGDHAGKA